MTPVPLGTGIETLWLIWAVIWLAAALRNKRARQREPFLSSLGYRIPLLIGSVLIFFRAPSDIRMGHSLFSPSPVTDTIAVALTAAGLGSCLWARWHLGRNWSGNVTLKEGHTLVRTGPYRYLRHPIYTGLLIALAGTVLVVDDIGAIFGFAFAFFGITRKLAREEQFMEGEFGDAYRAYRLEARRLIPFVW